mmetsp:Transcript_33601/g.87150  ORF Transcript_33601/g.87150 Transcript_33601/m.87150 type:complete len:234 (-) Transcript_33601:865-1566(-)
MLIFAYPLQWFLCLAADWHKPRGPMALLRCGGRTHGRSMPQSELTVRDDVVDFEEDGSGFDLGQRDEAGKAGQLLVGGRHADPLAEGGAGLLRAQGGEGERGASHDLARLPPHHLARRAVLQENAHQRVLRKLRADHRCVARALHQVRQGIVAQHPARGAKGVWGILGAQSRVLRLRPERLLSVLPLLGGRATDSHAAIVVIPCVLPCALSSLCRCFKGCQVRGQTPHVDVGI